MCHRLKRSVLSDAVKETLYIDSLKEYCPTEITEVLIVISKSRRELVKIPFYALISEIMYDHYERIAFPETQDNFVVSFRLTTSFLKEWGYKFDRSITCYWDKIKELTQKTILKLPDEMISKLEKEMHRQLVPKFIQLGYKISYCACASCSYQDKWFISKLTAREMWRGDRRRQEFVVCCPNNHYSCNICNKKCKKYHNCYTERAMSDLGQGDYIRVTTLEGKGNSCPKCHLFKEKLDGCDKLRCECGTGFCVKCSQELRGDYLPHLIADNHEVLVCIHHVCKQAIMGCNQNENFSYENLMSNPSHNVRDKLLQILDRKSREQVKLELWQEYLSQEEKLFQQFEKALTNETSKNDALELLGRIRSRLEQFNNVVSHELHPNWHRLIEKINHHFRTYSITSGTGSGSSNDTDAVANVDADADADANVDVVVHAGAEVNVDAEAFNVVELDVEADVERERLLIIDMLLALQMQREEEEN